MAVADQIKDFLEKAPLLKKQEVDLPQYYSGLIPEVLELYCEVCGTSRPHRDERTRGSGAGQAIPELSSGVYHFMFSCTGCRKTNHRFYVGVNTAGNWVRKIGRLPPWSINVGRQLAAPLAADAKVSATSRLDASPLGT